MSSKVGILWSYKFPCKARGMLGRTYDKLKHLARDSGQTSTRLWFLCYI